VICVTDSTDHRRIFETGLELHAVLENSKLAGVPLRILASKQDLALRMRADDITTELKLYRIRDSNWHIQACSTIPDQGLQEGLKWMV
jgi:hypothetical protein